MAGFINCSYSLSNESSLTFTMSELRLDWAIVVDGPLNVSTTSTSSVSDLLSSCTSLLRTPVATLNTAFEKKLFATKIMSVLKLSSSATSVSMAAFAKAMSARMISCWLPSSFAFESCHFRAGSSRSSQVSLRDGFHNHIQKKGHS